jgi:hypothetical protein
MKAPVSSLAISLFLLCSCAQGVGVPNRTVDPSMATGSAEGKAGAAAIELPERIVIPAAYRLMLVDGHLTLVRDTDPRTVDPGPSSLRIVAGETSGDELSYQSALLPQELAAEVASNRESSARMDNALDSVMQRSRELSGQAAELEAQAKRLGDLLAAAKTQVPSGASSQPPQTTSSNNPPEN